MSIKVGSSPRPSPRPVTAVQQSQSPGARAVGENKAITSGYVGTSGAAATPSAQTQHGATAVHSKAPARGLGDRGPGDRPTVQPPEGELSLSIATAGEIHGDAPRDIGFGDSQPLERDPADTSDPNDPIGIIRTPGPWDLARPR